MARRNRPGIPKPTTSFKQRSRSVRTRNAEPTKETLPEQTERTSQPADLTAGLPSEPTPELASEERDESAPEGKPPHTDTWEHFTIDCEAGELVCRFIPAHPRSGFMAPFLCEARNWIEVMKVVDMSASEELVAEQKQGAIYLHANIAGNYFLTVLSETMKEAVMMLLRESNEYAKHYLNKSPLAKRLSRGRKPEPNRQLDGTYLSPVEFARVDSQKSVHIILEPLQKRLTLLIKDTHGGKREWDRSYDLNDETLRAEYRTRVNQIREPWRVAIRKSERDGTVPSDGSALAGVSADLLKEALRKRRIASVGQGKIPRRLGSLAFALQQVAWEMGATKKSETGRADVYSYSTLEPYYSGKPRKK